MFSSWVRGPRRRLLGRRMRLATVVGDVSRKRLGWGSRETGVGVEDGRGEGETQHGETVVTRKVLDWRSSVHHRICPAQSYNSRRGRSRLP